MRLSPGDVNRLWPVSEIVFYGKGVVEVKRAAGITGNSENGGGERGGITYLSSKSRSRLAFVVAVTKAKFGSLLTLTYGEPFPPDGRLCKTHLNRFLTYLRRTYPDVSYVWVVEFQKRGALHFHVLLSLNQVTRQMRKEVASLWARISSPSSWLGHGASHLNMSYYSKSYAVHKHKKQWQELRAEDGAIRYMTKYCLKTEQKLVPAQFRNVGRFYGMSRDVAANQREHVTILMDTEALRILLEVEDHGTKDWEVAPKYLFGVETDAVL